MYPDPAVLFFNLSFSYLWSNYLGKHICIHPEANNYVTEESYKNNDLL